ncbi:MAG: TetR/AcrR family transcriptional regulator [Spirochaetales bacterium]|nr:TetR/AcrR family transcriptional regulator [Spirochaetales bacterium]
MSDKIELIQNSAFRLFTIRGFHNTPTSLIAKEAGVANGTLFNYFKTKDVLINHLYLTCKSSLIAAIQKDSDPEKDIKEQMRVIWENCIGWAEEYPEQYQFFKQYSNSPFIQNETKEEGRQKFTPFMLLLEKGVSDGVLKKMSAEFISAVMIGIASATIECLKSNLEAKDNQSFIEDAFLMLWDSIKA